MKATTTNFVFLTLVGYIMSSSLSFFVDEPLKATLSSLPLMGKPEKVVESYYEQLQRGNGGEAYDLWSENSKMTKEKIMGSVHKWGYHKLKMERPMVSGDIAVIDLAVDITNKNNKQESYQGIAVLERDGFSWQLVKLNLK